ncbi:MAG: GIY-YIG nuclease family protein [Ignavibacteria bacterium]|nr:GIY-YIG nuclease family protein [Ignavibacteria bacterium]
MYVLYSLKDKKRYVGFTENISCRFQQHSSGLVKSTIHRRPLILVYIESNLSKKAAMDKERFFKSGKGREFLKSVIKDNSPLSF